MANSIITRVGDGVTTQFSLNFTLGILRRSYITCRVGDEADGTGEPIYRTLEWITDGLVNIQGDVPGVGVDIVFTRTMPKDTLIHDYSDGVPITERNLDESNLQHIMSIHEFLDGRLEQGFVQDLNMNGYKILNLADGTADTDAANMRQLNATNDLANQVLSQAQASALLAQNWAVKLVDPVAGGEYSSKYHAQASALSASQSLTYRNQAQTHANDASDSKDQALIYQTGAQTARDFAYDWSSAPYNVDVDDGVHTGKSAYHWSEVARIYAQGTAENILYDPSNTGLSATNVQDALDEVYTVLDTDLTTLENSLGDLATEDIVTTALIGDAQVTNAKIDDSTIASSKLQPAAIQEIRRAPLVTANENRTFQLTDQGCVVGSTNTSNYTYTIAASSSIAFPIGTMISIIKPLVTGTVTIAPAAGVSLFWASGSNEGSGSRTMTGRSQATLYKYGPNEWMISGVGLE